MTLTKLDLKKEFATQYQAGPTPAVVRVPPLHFLLVNGDGEPSGSAFQEAVGALYSVSYTLKFALKKSGRLDWTVGPLEGLWWNTEAGWLQMGAKPDRIRWTAMIVQPEEVTEEDVDRAVADAATKRELPALRSLRYDVYNEGLAAQVLHLGPYAEEQATIDRLHRFIHEEGREARGAHHEIYLSDPHRTPAPRLKTIIRQPVAR